MSAIAKNLVLFKAGWLACVLGAAQGFSWLGPTVVALVVAEHVRAAPTRRPEALLLLAAAAVGFLWESAMVALGLLSYGVGVLLPGTAPVWMVALWLAFATTLTRSLAWLQRHWILAAVAGALGGPMAFIAGRSMGAVAIPEGWTALIVIGAGWAVLLPALTLLAQRLQRRSAQPTAAAAHA